MFDIPTRCYGLVIRSARWRRGDVGHWSRFRGTQRRRRIGCGLRPLLELGWTWADLLSGVRPDEGCDRLPEPVAIFRSRDHPEKNPQVSSPLSARANLRALCGEARTPVPRCKETNCLCCSPNLPIPARRRNPFHSDNTCPRRRCQNTGLSETILLQDLTDVCSGAWQLADECFAIG